MKICMLIWSFRPGPEGGAERQCWSQAEELVRQGHACVVVTHRPMFAAPIKEFCNGVEIRRLGLLGPFNAQLIRLKEALAQSIKHSKRKKQLEQDLAEPGIRSVDPVPRLGWLSPIRFLDYLVFMAESLVFFSRHRRDMDLIHVHESHWLAGWAVKLSRWWNIPVVVKETIYPVFPPMMPDIPLNRAWDRLRRKATAYIAIHGDIARALAPEVCKEARIEVLPNGVEIPTEQATLDGLNVLMVANLDQGAWHKAFDVLLEAWALVVRAVPDAKLTVVGRGDATEWMSLASRLGCENSISFPGSTPDVAAYYRTASVFVLPSRKEGLSNALLEAQSWGIPAVVSDIPGNRAVVDNGVNGCVVPVENMNALADSIVLLLTDRPLRERMGVAARKCMQASFSRSAVCEMLLAFYRELVKPVGE